MGTVLELLHFGTAQHLFERGLGRVIHQELASQRLRDLVAHVGLGAPGAAPMSNNGAAVRREARTRFSSSSFQPKKPSWFRVYGLLSYSVGVQLTQDRSPTAGVWSRLMLLPKSRRRSDLLGDLLSDMLSPSRILWR